MAVSPDRRFLYAASRSKPYRAHVYAIDRGTGELKPLSTSPLVESFPYIALDHTGRFLLGASYGGSVVSVNAVESDGRVAVEPLQVTSVGRNAHSIRVDASNRFVYVPTLGSDAIFMFTFDAKTGRLSSNTPAVFMMKAMTGPRHFIISGDNRFIYVLSEFLGRSRLWDRRQDRAAHGSEYGLGPAAEYQAGSGRTARGDRRAQHGQ